MKNQSFGELLRKKRTALGLSLRNFAKTKGYDPAYISRLENGFLSAPQETEKIKALALALEIEPKSIDWVEFFDLAAISKNEIPADLAEDNPNVADFLPAFFRTARKTEIKREDISRLLDLLRQDNEG